MEDSLKKLVYAGVGFAAQATEKLEKSIEDLVNKGKIEEEEGEKIVSEFISKSEKRKEDLEAKIKTTTEDVLSKFKLPILSEIKDLQKRVAVLEKELSKKTPAKAKVRKTVSKAKTTVKKATPTTKETLETTNA